MKSEKSAKKMYEKKSETGARRKVKKSAREYRNFKGRRILSRNYWAKKRVQDLKGL